MSVGVGPFSRQSACLSHTRHVRGESRVHVWAILVTSEEIFLLKLPFKCLHTHENWAGSPFGTYIFSSDVVDLPVWGPRPIVWSWAFAPTIAPQNSGFSLLSEEKMWDFDIYWINYHDFLTHACGSTVSRASLLLLVFCSLRGAINCTRWLYVPSHPTVGRLINSRYFSKLWARVIPFIFPRYIRLLREITFPFLEKTFKRSRAFQRLLSRNTPSPCVP